MLCYLYRYVACVTSDMIHISGDGAWDMRTGADWAPPLRIAAERSTRLAGRAVRAELLTETDVLANVSER